MAIQNQFQKQLDYLFSFIPKENYIFPGELGLKRTKVLLRLLKNPQEKVNVIHIAGTSGKGSTCYILSSILSGQGRFKVGLSLSPHIIDIRERTQIDNKLISKDLYCKYLEEIKPFIILTEKEVGSKPTYFEILTALNYYIFYKENVDYAIIETGLGGTYDATNVIKNSNKLSIITKIGFDHTKILGNTLSKIASQKGGIINSNSTVIIIQQSKKVDEVFEKICQEKNANLIQLSKDNFKKIDNGIFSFRHKGLSLPKVSLGLRGDYQFENASLALTGFEYISGRDSFEINKELLLKTLKQLQFLGRFTEKQIGNKKVIFDGAHNPQKMNSFLKSLKKIYPNSKFNFLIAFKYNKEYFKMLKMIVPIANSITLTKFGGKQFETLPKPIETKILANTLKEFGFENYCEIEEPQKAIEKLLNIPNDLPIVVTGSFYFLSEFSNYFK